MNDDVMQDGARWQRRRGRNNVRSVARSKVKYNVNRVGRCRETLGRSLTVRSKRQNTSCFIWSMYRVYILNLSTKYSQVDKKKVRTKENLSMYNNCELERMVQGRATSAS